MVSIVSNVMNESEKRKLIESLKFTIGEHYNWSQRWNNSALPRVQDNETYGITSRQFSYYHV